MRRALVIAAVSLSAGAGFTIACGPAAPRLAPAPALGAIQLAGQVILPDSDEKPPFGGISGLAPLRDGREMLAVSDDRDNSRVYRIAIEQTGDGMRIARLATVLLEPASGPLARLDPEGIAITRDGHMLVSSEGIGNEEPRLPPAIVEYTPDGKFVRQLAVRSRYAPDERGPLTTGVRENAGFEALTIAPDFSRLFTANEMPLVQDGEVTPLAAGSLIRILEYRAAGVTYAPAREFAYEISPFEPLPFTIGYAVNGVVELLSLGDDELLVLERGYAESPDRQQSLNRIRLYRASLSGATDVSSRGSLRAGGEITRVRKTLLLDLNKVPGLDARLGNLDNFEGLAWGPEISPPGGRSLVLVSDDNFNRRQVTAFLLFHATPNRSVSIGVHP